jgi:hypothetical protein
LVAHREFPGVARGCGGVAHGFSLFLAVPVLVDPADGFVLGPEKINFRMVDFIQQLQQRRFPGKEQTMQAVAIKQHRQILGELVKQAEEITLIGWTGFSQCMAGEVLIELETLGAISLSDGFEQEAALLSHSQGSEAIEYGKGLLSNHSIQDLDGTIGDRFPWRVV